MTNKDSRIHQYLTFILANEMYAINVANIKEVLTVPKVTKVPKMPKFMSGIINLRGMVVPVLDLCKKFSLGETSVTPNTNIIVIEIVSGEESDDNNLLTIGIFSDMVQKVITIEPDKIEPPPKIGVPIDNGFILGMGHVEDDFIILLNIKKILTGEEMQEIQSDNAECDSEESDEQQ